MSISSKPPVAAGVSGSPASYQAVKVAAREASALGCALRLAHAVSYRPGVVDPPHLARAMLRQAAAIAERIAPGLPVTTQLLEGDPVHGLLRLSRRSALIVVGDGNLNDRVCLPTGATAVQLAARSFSDVLVTRAAPAPYGPVVVGVNGSAVSDAALGTAFGEAAHRSLGLVVVHVGTARERVHELEDLVAEWAAGRGVEAELRSLTGDPATVLCRESRHASLVVVGARGDQPYHGLLGSVAQTLLHHGRPPIVLVRGAGSWSRPRHGGEVTAGLSATGPR
ncbi:universal stress protein [Paractinoplanes deccanensis]|uniref:Universal stress protein n=1 Tax=Paractinoplanes deccanensis TaxID=113561 RepID=A0ABQ3XZC9_9ACTN|nr:universal stress protein [Actinoplanes deccanensis]GID73090.1 universal stress protein [Actinoplanes deccanensis]